MQPYILLYSVDVLYYGIMVLVLGLVYNIAALLIPQYY